MTSTALILFIVVGLPVICTSLVFIVAIVLKSKSKQELGFEKEEAELIQQLHQGLTKLESRIESIETILLENEKNLKKQ